MRYLLLLLILPACGGPADHEYGAGQPPEQVRSVNLKLEEHVAFFERVWGHQVNYPVRVESLETEKVGVCYSWNTGERKIVISAEHIDHMSSQALKATVWHELGHCSLGRSHRMDMTIFKWSLMSFPASVMYMYGFTDSQGEAFEKEIDYYTRELLNP